MQIELRQISTSDICGDWLETLNDQNYMRFSRNAERIHTRQSQMEYVTSFEFQDSDFADKYLIGVFLDGQLSGTASVFSEPRSQKVDIGILIFKRFSSIGLGRSALDALTRWCLFRFPGYSLELGTHCENVAMQRVAKACGYIQLPICSDENFFFVFSGRLQFPSAFMLPGMQGDPSKPLLFFGSDIGGVEQLFEIFVRYDEPKKIYLTGSGATWAMQRQIKLDSFKLEDFLSAAGIVLSTSSDNSEVSELIALARRFGIPSIAILDHWTNFEHRFGSERPDHVLVTNSLALELAQKEFPDINVYQGPDLKLVRLQELSRVKPKVAQRHILVVLEPQRGASKGVDAIHSANYERLRKVIERFLSEGNFDQIYVRPHPSYDSDLQLSSLMDLGLKIDQRVEIDWYLSSADMILGFSSVLLYYGKKLGIPTASVLEERESIWRTYFDIPII